MNKVKTRGTPEPAEWPAWLPPGVKGDRVPRAAGTEPSAGSHLPCPARTKASGPVPKRYTRGHTGLGVAEGLAAPGRCSGHFPVPSGSGNITSPQV